MLSFLIVILMNLISWKYVAGFRARTSVCCVRQYFTKNNAEVDDITTIVNNMKAGEIKKILSADGVMVKDLFDKSELAKILIEKEKKASSNVCAVPLVEITLGNDYFKRYKGIDAVIQGQSFRFLIDTGASTNLIKESSSNRLNLSGNRQSTFSTGFGGGDTMRVENIIINDIQIGKNTMNLQFGVLKNTAMLPQKADGLLGLPFLNSLGIVDFNFEKNTFSFGKTKDILTPLRVRKFRKILTKRLLSGLMTVDTYISPTQIEPVYGLIDLGSMYSLANSNTVQLLDQSLQELPVSPVTCVGLAGKIINVHFFRLPNGLRLGSNDADSSQDIMDILAGDVPGIDQIGLTNKAVIILGIDVLCKSSLLVDVSGNCIYLPS